MFKARRAANAETILRCHIYKPANVPPATVPTSTIYQKLPPQWNRPNTRHERMNVMGGLKRFLSCERAKPRNMFSSIIGVSITLAIKKAGQMGQAIREFLRGEHNLQLYVALL